MNPSIYLDPNIYINLLINLVIAGVGLLVCRRCLLLKEVSFGKRCLTMSGFLGIYMVLISLVRSNQPSVWALACAILAFSVLAVLELKSAD